MNKTQIKKINKVKSFFIKSDKFTLDHMINNMFDGRAKNMLIDTYELLLSSFKKDKDFARCIDVYESKAFEIKQDYIDLCLEIKNFVTSK